MPEKSYLFGHQIVYSSKRTLTDQIHGILCEEIHRGRWRVGDRLPSITDLAEEGKVSRMPIQQAFNLLESEGYVRRQERVGTFLLSVMPKGQTPRGAIGILMLADEEFRDTNPLLTTHARVQKILESAVEIGYQIEPVYLRKSDDWQNVNKVGGLFSDRVKGIISLHPFPTPYEKELPSDRIPLVFWGPPPDEHFPCVHGDHVYAMRLLTKHVIEMGHTHIVFCPPHKVYETKARAQSYYAGYMEAMQEAGLPIDHDLIESFRAIPDGDLLATREILESLNETTAIICDRIEKIHDIILVTDMTGIKVPEDLSVVGSYTLLRSHDKTKFTTGIQYPTKDIIKACFDILFEEMKTGRCPVSQVLIKPDIRKGHSLAPPRSSQRYSSLLHSTK